MSSADWWAKQLGAQPQAPQQQRPMNMPMPASQQPMTPYVAPQPQAPSVTKAQSASQTQTCPDCGGSNYLSVQGAKTRCYDCGYGVTVGGVQVEQSGGRYGALTGAKVEGSAKGAIGNTTGGFNPMPEGYNSQGQKI